MVLPCRISLPKHRDTVLRAARVIDNSIRDVVPQQKWRWIRIHNISLARYMGGARDGGLRKLRGELEAENSGVHIPAEIRWLGRAKVRARFQASKNGSSSVVAAVLGEATFGRLCKAGVRFLGRRYEVDAFEEAGRPDAFCSRCSAWKHIAPHCLAAAPKCALCAGDHLTTDHRCPVERCKVGNGHPRPHGAAKCANCGEAHGAQADACAAKREARLSARGWWSPSPPRREKGAEAPQLPRGMERWARWGPKRGSNPARRVWRSRGPGGEISLYFVCRCGFFFFLCLAELGEKVST